MTTISKKSKPMNIIPKPTFITNPNTIPVSTTGLIWIDEYRYMAAAFLSCSSEIRKVDIKSPRAEELVEVLHMLTSGLAHNLRHMPLKDAEKLYSRALTKTRMRAKKLMAALGGDVLDFPNEFVDLYADIVVEMSLPVWEKRAKEQGIIAA